MYGYIRIINGDFFITDFDNRHYIQINNPKVNQDALKKKILENLGKAVKPLKARDLIYSSLSQISGYEVKKACKQVIEQEAVDPLYQDLLAFVLSQNKYQKLIKNTRVLKITKKNFSISDVNGTICTLTNHEFDTTAIEKMIDSLEKFDNNTTPRRLLKLCFIKHFNVSDATMNFSNPIIAEMLQKICNSKAYISKMSSKIRTGFKDGKIFVKLQSDYLTLPSHITVEALKEHIVLYLKEHKYAIKKNEIIFDSLKELTGFDVSKSVSQYIPTYVGESKIRKDILVEDPLYVELCEYIDTLPEFQENQSRNSKYRKNVQNSMQNSKILRAEQTFVDQFCYNDFVHINTVLGIRK